MHHRRKTDWFKKVEINSFISSIAVDVAKGVAYLHENGFLHNDLKTDNVVLHGNERGAKSVIINFGKSQFRKTVQSHEPKRNLVGDHLKTFLAKHCHIAPEVPRGGRESTASDVFSYGVLLKAINVKNNRWLETLNRLLFAFIFL